MSSSEPCPSTQRPRVSPRALLLALALMGPNAYWIIQIERVRQGPYPSILSLYVNVVFILLILVGTNGLVRRLRALLHLGYRLGASAKFFAGTGYGSVLFSELQDLFDHPRPADARANAALLGGLLGVVGLMALRTRFVGLPLHPMGYVLSGNWGMGLIWFPLFLSWLIKRLVLRAGGLRAYRHSQPFFLGLVLGECVIGPAWSWLGIALDVPTYNFWGA